jgi:hypothetical protein
MDWAQLDSAAPRLSFLRCQSGRTDHWIKVENPAAPGGEARGREGVGREAMTYRRGIAYHEAGHAVVGWSLGLRVTITRVFHDDAKGWKGGTDIPDASHLSLPERIAIYAAGYTSEQVFERRAHKQAALCDHVQIYQLLKVAGISEQDHPARIDEGNSVARAHLEAHKSKAIALAERLAECGHIDDASGFLKSL